ncbi:hypothetical protein K8I61_12030 [bacterium]|nr:hypothetical protein [bacterium]
MRQYRDFGATELFCARCRASVPVREVLLLVLPGKNLFDYRCTRCHSSVGTREEADPYAFSTRPPAAPPPHNKLMH